MFFFSRIILAILEISSPVGRNKKSEKIIVTGTAPKKILKSLDLQKCKRHEEKVI